MSDSIHQPCALVHDILDARPLFGHDLQARKQKQTGVRNSVSEV
jgi:hypothetical protein